MMLGSRLAAGHHSGSFDIDEKCMEIGAEVLSRAIRIEIEEKRDKKADSQFTKTGLPTNVNASEISFFIVSYLNQRLTIRDTFLIIP